MEIHDVSAAYDENVKNERHDVISLQDGEHSFTKSNAQDDLVSLL